MTQLLILGATGEMGRRIVRLSRRLLPDVNVIRASRKPSLDDPERRRVDIHEPESLANGLRGIDAVINAVGPFEYDPTPLIEACLGTGCHYVDIAETAEFVAKSQKVYRDDSRGVPRSCVLSGCSTIPGLVEVLCQKWANRNDVKEIRIFLSMGSANPVTPTLIFSLLRPLGSRAPDGSRYYDRLIRKTPIVAPKRLYGRFPSPFDSSGIIVGDRVLPARLHAGLDLDALDRVLWLSAKVMPWISSELLMRLCQLAPTLMSPLRKLGTLVGVLAIEALGEGETVLDEIDVRAEREGLDIPALPSVWAVRRLLSPDRLQAEVTRLDQLFKPEDVATWLREEGYQVVGI